MCHDSSVVGIQFCSDSSALRLKCKVQGLKVRQGTVKELIQLHHDSSWPLIQVKYEVLISCYNI